MRGRWLKPEFFTDKKIAQMGPITALVYQALWVSADDGGMAPADPELLKGQLFIRWKDIDSLSIQGALTELSLSARIQLYQGGDEIFAQVLSWDKNQKVNRPSAFRYADDYSKRGKDLQAIEPPWDTEDSLSPQ